MVNIETNIFFLTNSLNKQLIIWNFTFEVWEYHAIFFSKHNNSLFPEKQNYNRKNGHNLISHHLSTNNTSNIQNWQHLDNSNISAAHWPQQSIKRPRRASPRFFSRISHFFRAQKIQKLKNEPKRTRHATYLIIKHSLLFAVHI